MQFHVPALFVSAGSGPTEAGLIHGPAERESGLTAGVALRTATAGRQRTHAQGRPHHQHRQVHTSTSTRTRTRTRTHTHTHMHTQAHTHAHTHMHTHAHTQAQ